MRIAFFGLPLAAWLLHRDGHEIVYAGLSRPSPGTRRVTRVLPRVEMKPDVRSRRTIDLVRSLSPELVVSWFWTTKLPMELLEGVPAGAFGVHPSLLPRHRGPDPYFWAIDSGDERTGVTAHRIDREYDTGGILGCRVLPIDPSWNAWQLAKALDRPSLSLLREIAEKTSRGCAPEAAPQNEENATQAPTLTDEELELDWTWTSARIERRVRAAAPAPGAWTFFGDEVVTLLRVVETTSFPRALAPGEAAVVSGSAVVRTADGAVVLARGRVDGAEDEEPYELGADDLADLVEAMRTHEAGG
jgi:methionyl-tRNA formyltransferase